MPNNYERDCRVQELQKNVSEYLIQPTDLSATVWKEYPFSANYLQFSVFHGFTNSGYKLCLIRPATEIITITDGLKINRAFQKIWLLQDNPITSFPLKLLTGYFPNQIEQIHPIVTGQVIRRYTLVNGGGTTGLQYFYPNCEKLSVIVDLYTAGNAVNHDITITKQSQNYASAYNIINLIDQSLPSYKFEFNFNPGEYITYTIINNHTSSVYLVMTFLGIK